MFVAHLSVFVPIKKVGETRNKVKVNVYNPQEGEWWGIEGMCTQGGWVVGGMKVHICVKCGSVVCMQG